MTTTNATAVRSSSNPLDRAARALKEATEKLDALQWDALVAQEEEEKAAEERYQAALARAEESRASAIRKAQDRTDATLAKAREAVQAAKDRHAAVLMATAATAAKEWMREGFRPKKAPAKARASAATVTVDGKSYGLTAAQYMDISNRCGKSPLGADYSRFIRAIVAKVSGKDCPAAFRVHRKGNKTTLTFTTTDKGNLAFERK